nr:Abi family protein [Arthrobacter sp. UM1]
MSYYRMSGYWHPARLEDSGNDRGDQFKPGTCFADAAALYEADRKLRTLLHDGLERIEIALRTRIGEALTLEGPLTYTRPEFFRPTFDHAEWMSVAEKRISRSQRWNESIRHHDREYGGQYPFWVLAEVLDFADVSKLFAGLRAPVQRSVAEGLGIAVDRSLLSERQFKKASKNSPLARWCEQLTVVRNLCAHHGRLWNKSFVPAPTPVLRVLPGFHSLPSGQNERVFGVLVVMSQLLRVISPGTTWPNKAARLVNTDFVPNPPVTPEGLGITEGWNGEF